MFRLGKLDMRHPSWVCNQFILSGPNLCWQILGVKMLFEATSCNDTKRDPTTTLTQYWAPGLLSTKVLQAKRVEQDLGRTSWAKSNCAVWSSQDGCFFWLILSKGRTVFLFESQTARQFFTKILAFHRIPPLVCHNGHDPALTCRKTWKRRSVPVWFYASMFTCITVKNPPRWYFWWFRNPVNSPVEVGSLFHLQGFDTSQVVLAGFRNHQQYVSAGGRPLLLALSDLGKMNIIFKKGDFLMGYVSFLGG